MSLANVATVQVEQRAYEPPALTILGSVEAVTRSSRAGSISDFGGRTRRH